MADDTSPSAPPAEKPPKAKKPLKRIFLVPWPKVVFLYPTFLAAVVAGALLSWVGDFNNDPQSTWSVSVTLFFLGVLTINLGVLAFDFPRTTFLTLFFVIICLGLGSWIFFIFNPDMLPDILQVLKVIKPVANPIFYLFFGGLLGMIFIGSMIKVRFDYWEVTNNELLHHRGLLSDLTRYPTERLKIEKEIADVFEWILLGSGTLVLTPRDAHRPIVLENVLMISKKEKQLTELLGETRVTVSGS